jgi:hypothetical protein
MRAVVMLRGAIQPVRFVVSRHLFHEARPHRHSEVRGKSARDDGSRLVVADPHARRQMRRVADEPRIVIVVRRSRLARSRQHEPFAPGRPGSARVDDVGEHLRHLKRGRLADGALLLVLVGVEHLAPARLDTPDEDR